MYAGRVLCCLLVSHIEHAPRALLTLEKKMGQRERQTDGRDIDALRLPRDAASVKMRHVVVEFVCFSKGWRNYGRNSII